VLVGELAGLSFHLAGVLRNYVLREEFHTGWTVRGKIGSGAISRCPAFQLALGDADHEDALGATNHEDALGATDDRDVLGVTADSKHSATRTTDGWDKGAAQSRLLGRLSDPYPKAGLCGEAEDMSLSDRDRAGAF
jgi:hypothetical protein